MECLSHLVSVGGGEGDDGLEHLWVRGGCCPTQAVGFLQERGQSSQGAQDSSQLCAVLESDMQGTLRTMGL